MNDKYKTLKEQLQKFLVDNVSVRPMRDGGYLVQIPFRDSDGDPIRIVFYDRDDTIVINDAGIIAGRLFALGQHTQDTPAFRLLRSLEKAHGLKLDYDNGQVTTIISKNEMFDALMGFSKVVLAMITTIPHIRVAAHRLKPLGQRLKARVRDQYKQANILDLVQHDYFLSGETVERWPVDFHWWLRRNGNMEHVYVVTVDLDVIEALVKASKVTTLALDARRSLTDDKLRIVLDSHGGDSNARIASSLMKNHSDKLNYKVYDFGQDDDRQIFIKQSVDEITGEMGESWRDFWRGQGALT